MHDKIIKKLLLIFSLLLIYFGSGMAHAVMLIDGSNPEQILNIAKGYGSALLDKDEDGDPVINGRIEGTRYLVNFYNCTDGKNCNVILFRAAWVSDKIDLAAINGWNATKLFGRAYLDSENDPTLEMPVNLDKGVSEQNLDETFDYWRAVLAAFEQEIIKD